VCSECGEDIREAAAGIMFAAGRCGDLPELTFARTILANKFEGEFVAMAKEGAGVVDPMVTRTTSYVHSWPHHIHTRNNESWNLHGWVCATLSVGMEANRQQRRHGAQEKGGERGCC
jgi:hypothetical protein